MILVHGTCVEVDGFAVLLFGPSGCGKSDLALRMIDEGANLIADDQVALSLDGNHVIADVPATIAGLIEVRGVGIIRIPFAAAVPLALAVELREGGESERLPELATVSYFDHVFPKITLDPFTVSATAKIRFIMRHAIHRAGTESRGIMSVL